MPDNFSGKFFNCELQQWLSINLTSPPSSGWPSLFAVGCWLLWDWRNKGIFHSVTSRPTNPSLVVRRTSNSFLQPWQSFSLLSRKPKRQLVHIKWLPPPSEYWKLNTDGSSQGNPGKAGAGGIIRNSDGGWVKGFQQSIGHATAIVAELWGILSGLELA